jgi:hypothetical protein
MTTLREAAQQALEALEIGYDSAQAEATQYHAAMAGYRPERHAAMDADVQKIAKAITALRDALAQEEPRRTGLPHCEHSCEANAFQIEIRRLKAELAAEREACADICDQHASVEGIAQRCAEQIRARSKK